MSAPHELGGGPRAPRTGLRRSTISWLLVMVLALALAAGMSLIHLPYAIYSPGPATNTLGTIDGKKIISVTGAKTYPASGTLDFTTVSLYGGPNFPVNGWDYLRASFDQGSHIVPEKEVFPKGVTGQQIQQENSAEMKGSQDEAIVVALRALGKKVPERAVIAQVMDSSPAKGVLQKGDIIRAVDGVKTAGFSAVQKQVERRRPGSTIPITVERDGKDLTVRAKTRDEKGRTVLGIRLSPRFTFPVNVKIYAGDVGGPSAGMMFSLGIYDTLTPGSLTGGTKFAGTGTLDSEGNVGPIGGIRQKLVGARNEGAQWFLAPADNCNEVVGHIPDGLQVAKVSTFDQARHVVDEVGQGHEQDIPRCTK